MFIFLTRKNNILYFNGINANFWFVSPNHNPNPNCNMQVHTSESLIALKRSELIKLAVSSNVASKSAAYSSKSAKLVEAILANQTPAEAATNVEVVEEVSNVVPFTEPEADQTEIPMLEKPTGSSVGLFKVNRKVFYAQVNAAGRLAKSPNMPILNNVLIVFGDNRIGVEGTNLDIHLATESMAETVGAGSVTVPASVLSKFISKCTSEFLIAEILANDQLLISDLENKTRIMGLGVAKFPPRPAVAPNALLTIGGKRLARVIADVEKSASEDESRYILNSVAIVTTDPERAVVVSTDGRRLVKVDLGAESVVPNAKPNEARVAILPVFAARLLMATVPQNSVVTVAQNEAGNRLTFTTDVDGFKYTLFTRMVDGNYPQYEQVIPKPDYGTEFTVNGAELLTTIDRVSVFLTELSSSVKLEFFGGRLRFSGTSPDVGSGTEPIAAPATAEPPRDANGRERTVIVGVNPTFLQQIVGSWKAETLKVRVNDDVSPVFLTSDDRIAVVMPVRMS